VNCVLLYNAEVPFIVNTGQMKSWRVNNSACHGYWKMISEESCRLTSLLSWENLLELQFVSHVYVGVTRCLRIIREILWSRVLEIQMTSGSNIFLSINRCCLYQKRVYHILWKNQKIIGMNWNNILLKIPKVVIKGQTNLGTGQGCYVTIMVCPFTPTWEVCGFMAIGSILRVSPHLHSTAFSAPINSICLLHLLMTCYDLT
jgi:hypothetical protein